MIIPFTRTGIWAEAKRVGGKWRVIVHTPKGDYLFDSGTYPEDVARGIAHKFNQDQMKPIGINH